MKEALRFALTSDCRAGGWRENEEEGASGCASGPSGALREPRAIRCGCVLLLVLVIHIPLRAGAKARLLGGCLKFLLEYSSTARYRRTIAGYVGRIHVGDYVLVGALKWPICDILSTRVRALHSQNG